MLSCSFTTLKLDSIYTPQTNPGGESAQTRCERASSTGGAGGHTAGSVLERIGTRQTVGACGFAYLFVDYASLTPPVSLFLPRAREFRLFGLYTFLSFAKIICLMPRRIYVSILVCDLCAPILHIITVLVDSGS